MSSGSRFSDLVRAMTQFDSPQNGLRPLSARGRSSRNGTSRGSHGTGGMTIGCPYPKEAAEAVQGFLNDVNMRHDFDEEEGLFTFYMRTRAFFRFLIIRIRLFEDGILVTAESPIFAPYKDEKRMREATEMICRMNFGVRGGAFDLDVSDGELYYRRYILFSGIVPTRKMVASALGTASAAFRIYGKAIAEVFLGISSAEDAVNRAEEANFGENEDE